MKKEEKGHEDEIKSVIILRNDGTFSEMHGEPLRKRMDSVLTDKYDVRGDDKASDLFRVCLYHRAHCRMMDDEAYGILNEAVQEYHELLALKKVVTRLVSDGISDKTKENLLKKIKRSLEKISQT